MTSSDFQQGDPYPSSAAQSRTPQRATTARMVYDSQESRRRDSTFSLMRVSEHMAQWPISYIIQKFPLLLGKHVLLPSKH